MHSGKIKWFSASKGYGFIEPDDGGEDHFIHVSALEKANITGLREGDKLTYELEKGRNGKYAAANVQRIE